MKLLLAVTPTILLMAYSQLVSKWRVAALAEAGLPSDGASRLVHYLTDPWIISSYLMGLLASIAWLYAIEKFPVSLAFPTYIGLLFAVVTLGSMAFLREQVGGLQVLGIGLILAGVALVSRAV